MSSDLFLSRVGNRGSETSGHAQDHRAISPTSLYSVEHWGVSMEPLPHFPWEVGQEVRDEAALGSSPLFQQSALLFICFTHWDSPYEFIFTRRPLAEK